MKVFPSRDSETHVSNYTYGYISYVLRAPFQIFKPVKVNRTFSKRIVKKLFLNKDLQKHFLSLIFILFYNSFETFFKVRKEKKWLFSNLSLEQS